MNYSPSFFFWLTQAHNALTAKEQQQILSEAKDELTAEEYNALVKTLKDTRRWK